MAMPPPLPPQAVPAPKQTLVKPEREAPSSIFGTTIREWKAHLQRCPYGANEQRIKWLGMVHGLSADQAAKVLAGIGDVPELTIEEYTALIFGPTGYAPRDAVDSILAILGNESHPAISKSVEAIELRTAKGNVLLRRAEGGVVVGLTIDRKSRAMRWLHVLGSRPLEPAIADTIRQALDVEK